MIWEVSCCPFGCRCNRDYRSLAQKRKYSTRKMVCWRYRPQREWMATDRPSTSIFEVGSHLDFGRADEFYGFLGRAWLARAIPADGERSHRDRYYSPFHSRDVSRYDSCHAGGRNDWNWQSQYTPRPKWSLRRILAFPNPGNTATHGRSRQYLRQSRIQYLHSQYLHSQYLHSIEFQY